MISFHELFDETKPVIGMIHLLPLPGTPFFNGSIDDIYVRALADAYALQQAGVDAILVENYGDHPYLAEELAIEQTSLMSAVTREVKLNCSIPVGVNVQFNAWQAEIAIAHACEAQFVRVEVFVDTVVTPQGMVAPCAALVTRYRHALGASDVQIWADIQPNGSRNLLSQSLVQSALDAEAAGADAIIVTSAGNGSILPVDELAHIKESVSKPIIAGSGITVESVVEALSIADGAIVGRPLKIEQDDRHGVSIENSIKFMKRARHTPEAENSLQADS